MNFPSIFILACFVIIIIILIVIYKRLARLRNSRKKAFVEIRELLPERRSLILQLLEITKDCKTYEKENIETLFNLHNAAAKARFINDIILAENRLMEALSEQMPLFNASPNLCENQRFLQLQSELTKTKNKLDNSSRVFNSATLEYNAALESSAASVFVKMYGLKQGVVFNA